MTTVASTGARIVVVDEEQATVEVVRRTLRRAGYLHVRVFTDSRAALDACAAWDPDLIVADLRMPCVIGTRFVEALRELQTPDEYVPVLVLASDRADSELTRALIAGANDYAVKPIAADELLLRVRNLLTVRIAHDALKRRNANLAAAFREIALGNDERARQRDETATRVRVVIEAGGPDIHLQPVIDLTSGRTAGYEALARFPDYRQRTPDVWFRDAVWVGLGTELEIAAIAAAQSCRSVLTTDQYLAINVSPATFATREFVDLVEDAAPNRTVYELTEHQPIDDYDTLQTRVDQLRCLGVRLAVDDVGAGYANMRHILKLRPDFIKLDIALTRDVDNEPVKSALAAALAHFGERVGATVVAEGIETAEELDRLRSIGVGQGQGYHLGRPEPAALDEVVRSV